MIAVVQRVTQARVIVGERTAGKIESGLLVLAAVHADDTEVDAAWMAGKLTTLRIFPKEQKAYDVDVQQADGALLLVSNFTVAAETASGRRPSLSAAASPGVAAPLFQALIQKCRELGAEVETGEFGADMRIEMMNEGPTTFVVDSRDARKRRGEPTGA